LGAVRLLAGNSHSLVVNRMKKEHNRIALLHHAGGGNLGDDATLEVVIRNIRVRWANAEISALTMNTGDTAARHGIPCYPMRRYQWEVDADSTSAETAVVSESGGRLTNALRAALRLPAALWNEGAFLARSYGILKSFDLLIVSGGGQLTERGGPWSFPYAIFVWTRMARRAGLRCIFLNVGAGPLNRPLSRFFVRHALNAADYVSFRDRQSQQLAQSLGYNGSPLVFPDNVYGIELDLPARRAIHGARPVVGINPMPYPFCDLPKVPADAQEMQDQFIGKMADFTSLLAQDGFAIRFFGSDLRWDPLEIEHLRKVLIDRHRISLSEYLPITTVDELLGRMSQMDRVVTCRYHGVVLAHLLNKPVLAIAHHPKVTDLMQSLGLSEYCVDMLSFDPIRLMDTFRSLVANAAAIKAGMAERLVETREQSKAQFDELFGPPRLSATLVRDLERAVAYKSRA